MHTQPERSLCRQPTDARTPESGGHPGVADTVLSAPLSRWMTHSDRSPSPVAERKPDIAEAALQQYAHIHALIFCECSHCDGAMQCCAVAVGRHGHEARTVTTSAPAVAPVPRAAGFVAVACPHRALAGYQVLEDTLEGRKFLVNETFTAADIAVRQPMSHRHMHAAAPCSGRSPA